ncbi:PfkB family carbohydrate kinase [Maricaulis maris]|uniref:pyridoxal kinase n=1 Tax=Maricaulis maris TaxID=74318 RepID=A0A495D6R0_9PROT|nr:PfkB family carbohydrate kinase [Maricaulis maris]RKQ96650.1 pyridoxal kinase [Maricaulis maris]
MLSMPMALILSSHVAASMVGGGASQRVLNAAKIDTVLVPTVLYGRHPGWGAPGGGPVEQDQFEGILSGISDQGLLDITDIVLTGYFADVGQIFDTAAVIDVVRKGRRVNKGVKAFSREPFVVVDPIMGDAPGGLYVSPAIAAAIKDQLISRADLVTPNLFELGHITGRPLTDLASMVRAARAMARPVLVSSLPRHGQIGVLYVDEQQAWLVAHDRLPKAPNGTGDALTAAFISRILAGDDAKTALEQAVAATVSLVMRAQEWAAPELPLVAAADVLVKPLVTLEAEAVQTA